MATIVSSIPTLTEKLREISGFYFEDPVFSYEATIEDGEPQEFKLSTSDKYFHTLYDNRAVWTPDSQYGLIVAGHLKIDNTGILFGSEGIAPSNSTISIGLRWTSGQSRKRGTKFIQDIQIDNTQKDFEYNFKFPANLLRGVVDFSIVLYLKETYTPLSGEEHLAHIQGTVIGESNQYRIMLDGSEPDLSIQFTDREEDKNKSLWFLTMNCQNPLEMPFDSKALTIWINKRHPDFKFIDQQNRKNYCPAMLREVISNALSLFVNSLRSETDSGCDLMAIIEGKTDPPLPNSIGQTMIHFTKDLEMDFSNPLLTSISIKTFIDKNLSKL